MFLPFRNLLSKQFSVDGHSVDLVSVGDISAGVVALTRRRLNLQNALQLTERANFCLLVSRHRELGATAPLEGRIRLTFPLAERLRVNFEEFQLSLVLEVALAQVW